MLQITTAALRLQARRWMELHLDSKHADDEVFVHGRKTVLVVAGEVPKTLSSSEA